MEYSMDEFYKLAEEKFGEKFTYAGITITDESLISLNETFKSDFTVEDFENYKQVWLLKPECPNCGSELEGMFGSFKWALVHGEGYCSECNKVTFTYYHYIDRKRCYHPVVAYSLSGF